MWLEIKRLLCFGDLSSNPSAITVIGEGSPSPSLSSLITKMGKSRHEVPIR